MLTDKQCRNAKPKERAYKLADGQGLHLYVSTTGHRSWRLKYRFAKKERRLVFGACPEVGLAEAREATKAARALLREVRDPGIEAKRRSLMNAARSADTFELIAREWHGREAKCWKLVHAKDVITSLERDIFPFLGAIPISEIDTIMVLNVLFGPRQSRSMAAMAAASGRGNRSMTGNETIARHLAGRGPEAI